jgi:hypothetical protein
MKFRLHINEGIRIVGDWWKKPEYNQDFGDQWQKLQHNQYQRKYYGCQDKFIRIERRLLHFETFALSNMQMPTVWQHQIDSLTLYPARFFL